MGITDNQLPYHMKYVLTFEVIQEACDKSHL